MKTLTVIAVVVLLVLCSCSGAQVPLGSPNWDDRITKQTVSARTEPVPERPRRRASRASVRPTPTAHGAWVRCKASHYFGIGGTYVTAATRWPRGTKLLVRRAERSVTVRVTDYGPNPRLHPDRCVDLSTEAFAKLAPLSRGVVTVEVREL